MKKIISLLGVMLCLSCGAQTFYQYQRWTTNLDGSLVNGNTVTNLQGSNVVTGSLNSNKLDAATLALFSAGAGASLGIVTNNGSGKNNWLTNSLLKGSTNIGELAFLDSANGGSPVWLTNQSGAMYFGTKSGLGDFLVGSIWGGGTHLTSLPSAALLTTGTLPNATLSYRAGTTNIGNLSTSQVVLFTSAMADANYSVTITFDTAVASAVSAAATSKTINGFTITLSAGIAGTTTVDYTAWAYR